MFSIETYLKDKKIIIDKELDKRLPADSVLPVSLHEAIRYTVFSGGKRLRPVMCLAAAEAIGGDQMKVLPAALAIELLHTYSLVHDDLPDMDDDDVRRGQPTCHIKYGAANAILTGDALLTMSFEWLALMDTVAPDVVNLMVVELAKAAGSTGMVAGQVEDIRYENEDTPGAEALSFVHQHKTADLFKASVRIGAIGVNAKEEELVKLTSYAEKFGLAFQILDDIDDVDEDKSLSAVTEYGLEGAKKKARELVNSALVDLDSLSGEAQPLRELAAFIIKST